MRIFIAGASGVVGRALVPLLVSAGHEVAGLTRSAAGAETVRALGARPVVGDVYDEQALREAVVGFQPDAIIDELTDLPDDSDRIADFTAANSRIRRLGTRNLLAAARAAGTPRFLAQSVAWPLPGDGGAAVAELESAVVAAGGVVLRYGQLHGPGTYHERDLPNPPRVHVAEAARRTVAALDHRPGTVETIVDPPDGG